MPTEKILIHETVTLFVPGLERIRRRGIDYIRTERHDDALGLPIFERESDTMTDDQSAEERTIDQSDWLTAAGGMLSAMKAELSDPNVTGQGMLNGTEVATRLATATALVGIGIELRRIAAAQESASTTVNSFHIHGADEPRTAEEGNTTEPRMAEGGYTTDPRAAGWSGGAPEAFTANDFRRASEARTLGDIAQVLQIMKDAGMTRDGIAYALDQVYGDAVRKSPHTIVRQILTEKGFAAAWAWRDQEQADIVYDLMLRAVEEARR